MARRLLTFASLWFALLVSGCATQPLGRPISDHAAGETVTQLRRVIVFSRPATGRAANGVEYLYVAPVEVDRQGYRTLYLWAGILSTTGRSDVSAIHTLEIASESTSLKLPMLEWDSAATRNLQVGAPIERSFRTSVSRSDLGAIAVAERLEAVLVGEGREWSYFGATAKEWDGIAGDLHLGLSVEVRSEPER